jgi:hypothetical protein
MKTKRILTALKRLLKRTFQATNLKIIESMPKITVGYMWRTHARTFKFK